MYLNTSYVRQSALLAGMLYLIQHTIMLLLHIHPTYIVSCGFKNEDEIHFFLACPLYYRPRVTLLNALAHIAPLTVRTLLYGNDTYEIEENKIIITETLRFIKESKRFD